MIKNENYINIQGWMLNELKLKGNELIIYAIIYGFSQDDESYFEGSRKYLSCWTDSSIRTVQNCLNNLVEKKYIEKKEEYKNGIKFCKYRTSLPVKNLHQAGEKSSPGGSEKSSPGGSEKSSHNNIESNNIEIKNRIKDIEDSAKQKIAYGEFKNVFLTKEEYNKLLSKYPFNIRGIPATDTLKKGIEILSNYLESKGKDKYKSHYAVLNTNQWVYNEVLKQHVEEVKRRGLNYGV